VGTPVNDLGNISTTLVATINRNSVNVNLLSFQLQYNIGAGWVNIESSVPVTNTPQSFNISHSDPSLVNITSINYRVQVVDEFQTTNLVLGSRTFVYRNLLGYTPNATLDIDQILNLSNFVLSDSRSRVVSNVTAGAGNYTYYAYRAGAGDLTSILLSDGGANTNIFGAFQKLADVNGVNSFGASVSYRVYRSNSTNAFTNNTLSFS
jgi:hypothetical protein